ncbi:MAG: DUF4249 domain-containing protein [Calditrichaeota bacterium]|nr:MAG: DUF4249 domain-containing protein [Calditrichota bacterium]MBL1206157.1 DUF4249 domain-containing protein [Calditrichota bacterium]NOG45982.1 DUF4249 domain-containing protein [Calditrichota bacterium]
MKNRILKISFSLVPVLLFMFACEEIIEIELNSSNPNIVIEGNVTDQPGPYQVKITQTTDYYNPDSIPTISNAEVQISDNLGNTEVLTKLGNGLYETQAIQGTPGRTYTLQVLHDGESYNATSFMPHAINIDSFYYTQEEGNFRDKNNYKLVCVFKDNAGIDDYCRIKVFKNNELESGYFLYNGRLSDGNRIEFDRFRVQEIKQNDKIQLDLLTIDKTVYEYYSTLSDAIASDPRGLGSSEVLANPNSNISGGALGYFGAYPLRTDSLVIK